MSEPSSGLMFSRLWRRLTRGINCFATDTKDLASMGTLVVVRHQICRNVRRCVICQQLPVSGSTNPLWSACASYKRGQRLRLCAVSADAYPWASAIASKLWSTSINLENNKTTISWPDGHRGEIHGAQTSRRDDESLRSLIEVYESRLSPLGRNKNAKSEDTDAVTPYIASSTTSRQGDIGTSCT